MLFLRQEKKSVTHIFSKNILFFFFFFDMKPPSCCTTCRLQFNSIIISSHKSEFLRKCTYYYFQVLPNICLKFQDFTKFTSNGTFLKSLVDSLSNPSFPLNLALNFITQNRRERTGYSLYRRLTEAFAEGPSFKAVVSKGKANLVIVVK